MIKLRTLPDAHRACAGQTDHLETRALPEGPGVSRGPHEMPLVPFS
ncbi:unnamed protein product [Staurois parvus]|uniref:Uncharacterized protein n=1 Tax=Staurois parvus TaxID=386267 RepID=A0ABN9BFS1_9NEOB|nr:unnamed protein product [Staurois parvus]